mmetsp:Transcript_101564/g.255977  ORF Transcript_101564/g.255977 Transcript_101564/m.255977 type:complete len:243 (+) Transcript_101564:1728-2456(+)
MPVRMVPMRACHVIRRQLHPHLLLMAGVDFNEDVVARPPRRHVEPMRVEVRGVDHAESVGVDDVVGDVLQNPSLSNLRTQAARIRFLQAVLHVNIQLLAGLDTNGRPRDLSGQLWRGVAARVPALWVALPGQKRAAHLDSRQGQVYRLRRGATHNGGLLEVLVGGWEVALHTSHTCGHGRLGARRGERAVLQQRCGIVSRSGCALIGLAAAASLTASLICLRLCQPHSAEAEEEADGRHHGA